MEVIEIMSSNNRSIDELRPVSFELNYVIHPEGSVLVSMGNTKVLCNATVENTLPRWLKYSKKRHGWVTAEYSLLPRSTQKRLQREIQMPKGRTQEIQRLIARSLRGAVDLDKLGERQITVDCDVIQADGGTRTAAITGGYVAMALAVHNMRKNKKMKHNPIKQAIAAVSVGLLNGEAVLDLDYELDLAAEVDLNVVMTADGRYVEVQGTAEGEPFDKGALNNMLALAEMGIEELLLKQADALAVLEE